MLTSDLFIKKSTLVPYTFVLNGGLLNDDIKVSIIIMSTWRYICTRGSHFLSSSNPSVIINIFKHLRNHWANQSQLSCRSSLGWGNESLFKWAPSSEFVSSSIPSWQILTAHAQLFRGARDLAFCLKVPLDSLLVWASSRGSGETERMRRLAWTFAARIGDKYQIRLTRSKWFWSHKMAAMPIFGIDWPMSLKLGIQCWALRYY